MLLGLAAPAHAQMFTPDGAFTVTSGGTPGVGGSDNATLTPGSPMTLTDAGLSLTVSIVPGTDRPGSEWLVFQYTSDGRTVAVAGDVHQSVPPAQRGLGQRRHGGPDHQLHAGAGVHGGQLHTWHPRTIHVGDDAPPLRWPGLPWLSPDRQSAPRSLRLNTRREKAAFGRSFLLGVSRTRQTAASPRVRR
jgi:hypothetical protein